jgi:RND family efflux transporter MFP subunit
MKLGKRCFTAAALAATLLGASAVAQAQAPAKNQSPALPTASQPLSALRQSSPGNAQTPPATGTFQGNSLTSVPAAIKCIHDVELAAQADGLLQELLVEEGAAVEKGQLVLTIDERTAMAELAVAEKEAEAAAAQASQDANLRFSRKASQVSDAEYLESKELYERNSASLTETRRKQLEAEKAHLGIEVAEVDHAKDILAHHVAKEKVSAAKVQVELRKVVAPYDGIIVERKRDQGEWVKAGEPILRLVHLKEMRVEANVPVRGASVALLQNAWLRLHVFMNGEDVPFDTKIEYISPVIEMNTCRIWARIPNQIVNGSWMLRDGMEATVDIYLAPAQPVSAPATANGQK